jgi:hypothetical protein
MSPNGFLKKWQVLPFVWSKGFWVWSAFVLGTIGISSASIAAILNQENFENGDKAPWEIFVTPNGTVGGGGLPTVVIFDTVQEGQESKSLKFKVGQVRYDPDQTIEQGGGLVIEVETDGGMLHLSAHVAVSYYSPKDRRNLAGGLFEWVVDGQAIAVHDVGPIKHESILRHHLTARHHVNAGAHTIRLRLTRPFVSHPGQPAPFQYVDNLLIRLSPNP